MNKKVLSFVLAGMMLVASVCSTVVLEGGEGNGKEDIISSEPVTVHGSMYGFDWQGKDNGFFAKDRKKKLQPIYRVADFVTSGSPPDKKDFLGLDS